MRDQRDHEILTVTCPEHRSVHLAMAAAGRTFEPETLCGQAVESGRPALSFLMDGCLDCALIALERGVTSANDFGRAAVHIPSFVARQEGGSRTDGLRPRQDSNLRPTD